MDLDLNNHLERRDKETASVGVVLANPEKSKRLETVTMGPFWVREQFVFQHAHVTKRTVLAIPY